jgi:acetyl esterase/lipase
MIRIRDRSERPERSNYLLLAAAALLFFLSLWIIVPAPNMALLPLGVGAPEMSPLLLLASLPLVVLLCRRRGGAIRATAAGLAVLAMIISAMPLVQFPSAVRRFDAALSDAGVVSLAGRETPGRVRARPLVARDLLLGIDSGESHVVRGVEFAAGGNRPLTLDVYRPVPGGRAPVLVQIYGGAWQRGAPADDEVFASYFASRGHVVFAIDYRHAPESQWPAQIADVRAALTWIRAHAGDYEGDPARLALVGRSAGAQLALMTAYLEGASRVSAVVSYYGPTNLAEGWRVPPRPDPLGVRAVLESYLGGTPDEVPDRYRAASPVTQVSAAAPPTLLVYGTRDHVVEARFGRELHERLRAAGATSVLLEIPWAEHAFDALPGGLSGQLSLYYTERFLAWALGAG